MDGHQTAPKLAHACLHVPTHARASLFVLCHRAEMAASAGARFAARQRLASHTRRFRRCTLRRMTVRAALPSAECLAGARRRNYGPRYVTDVVNKFCHAFRKLRRIRFTNFTQLCEVRRTHIGQSDSVGALPAGASLDASAPVAMRSMSAAEPGGVL